MEDKMHRAEFIKGSIADELHDIRCAVPKWHMRCAALSLPLISFCELRRSRLVKAATAEVECEDAKLKLSEEKKRWVSGLWSSF
jgi:hypothetical protein